ncbi:hypothetical protein [Glycomyces sp. NRRL B-16210]|uniref:hypothetical protein n=1 Tax=Glycomyces sp. NRRL B-16210 TaxID=1463821 RepID=UPI0004BF01E9|nr:hypothetical protein [Glycomyces sp. NRRL B-16210]
MDDPPASRLGSPQRHWDAAEGAPALAPKTAPAVADLDDFTARVALRSPRWQGPVLLFAFAVVCAVCAVIPDSSFTSLSAETRGPLFGTLSAVLVAASAAVLFWDLRTRASAYREAYDRFAEYGITARSFLTPLNVGHEQFEPAWVLIDADLPGPQAARLHAAFGSWIDAVVADRETAEHVRRWSRTTTDPYPSEKLFGPEAAGGFLTGNLHRSRWHLLIPSGPPGERTRWKIRSIHDGDTSGEPVPVVGAEP